MKHRLDTLLLTFLLMFAAAGVTGCGGTKVVFVPESDALIRLGPGLRGHVYFWNGSTWELSSNPVDLPEGWYAGSLESQEVSAN